MTTRIRTYDGRLIDPQPRDVEATGALLARAESILADPGFDTRAPDLSDMLTQRTLRTVADCDRAHVQLREIERWQSPRVARLATALLAIVGHARTFTEPRMHVGDINYTQFASALDAYESMPGAYGD